MKTSEINFKIRLDDQSIPDEIEWNATDLADEGDMTTKSISLSIWDHHNSNTLRIDLWTKDMPMNEMKKFYIDSIGGLATSLLNATGDEYMAAEMNELCDRLVEHVKNSEKG